jgi:hypothetical protein
MKTTKEILEAMLKVRETVLQAEEATKIAQELSTLADELNLNVAMAWAETTSSPLTSPEDVSALNKAADEMMSFFEEGMSEEEIQESDNIAKTPTKSTTYTN